MRAQKMRRNRSARVNPVPGWSSRTPEERARLGQIFDARHTADGLPVWKALSSTDKQIGASASGKAHAAERAALRASWAATTQHSRWADARAREQEAQEAAQSAQRERFRKLGAARIVKMLRARLPGVLLRGTTHAFPKSTYLTLISPEGDALAQVRISDHASPEYGGYRTVGGTSDRWGRADVLIDPAQPDATVTAQVERAVREIRSAIAELTPRDNPGPTDDRVTRAIYAALARQSKQAGKAARLEAGDIREAMVRWVKRKPQIRTLVPILDRMVARGLLTVHEVSRVGTRYVGAGGAANYDPTPRPDYKRDRYYQMTPAGFADARRLAALHGAPKENPAGRLPPITPGNLGGPGYTAKSARARHAILRSSVAAEGYRSTLGKILLLERYGACTMHRDTQRLLARDRSWLRETFGGPGSFSR